MARAAGCSSSITGRRIPAAHARKPAIRSAAIPTARRAESCHALTERLALLAALAACASLLHPASAAHAQIGTPVADVELATLDGGKARLLESGGVNVLVFLRPGQAHSLAALRGLGDCRKGLAGKPVRWIGLVSDSVPRDAAAGLAREADLTMPVLIDEGDRVYGSLGVALHPVIVIVDAAQRLAAFEPFRAINYCTVVTARIRRALGEIAEAQLAETLSPSRAQEGGDQEVARRYRALAEALFKAKNYDKALESARQSLDKDPASGAAHALLGTILVAQGKCEEAVGAFREALKLDPAEGSAKEGLQRCER